MTRFSASILVCFFLAGSQSGFSRMSTDQTGLSFSKSGQRGQHLKRQEKIHVFQSAGVPKTHRKYYVVDLTVPPALGGSSESSNLQLQSKPEAKAKDRVEKYLVQKVRAGEMSLEEAQREIKAWKHVRLP